MIWNKCMFCGEEIFSIKYKPIQISVNGITDDEETKIILMGYTHKSCRNNFLKGLIKLCNDNVEYPIETEDSYIQ